MTQSTIELIATNTNRRLILRGIRVRSLLAAMGQKTTVEQTYFNPGKKAVEAQYTFPLPHGAAVCGVEVFTKNRVLTAQIEEQDTARQVYDQAIEKGHGAVRMDQNRPDVFTMNVGNIPSQETVTIRITYISELVTTDGSLRVEYPTVVAPRYVSTTGWDDPQQALRDGETLNPPHMLEVPYGLSLEVEVDLGREVSRIQSPTHQLRHEALDHHRHHLALSEGLTATNKAIVIELELAQEIQPQAELAKHDDGHAYLAVTFVPQFETVSSPSPSEVVFVLDCSDSMDGPSIRQACHALEQCLRHLSEHDSFNIYRFGSRFNKLAPQSLPCTRENYQIALDFLANTTANMGGTEIHGPLHDILTTPAQRGMRNILVLTDGQVSNENPVIRLARQHQKSNRIFSFGIGPASGHNLVRGLAQATGGASEFIAEGEKVEPKILRTFSRIISPQVTQVKVQWGMPENQIELASPEIPPIYEDDALVIRARCPLGSLPAKVTLTGQTAQGPVQWEAPVVMAEDSRKMLGTLWARQAIAYLETDPEHNAKRLVSLSRQFGMLCSKTSFICVEHRSVEDRTLGLPELRRIPLQIPQGWHGIDIMPDNVRFKRAAPQDRLINRVRPVSRVILRNRSVFLTMEDLGFVARKPQRRSLTIAKAKAGGLSESERLTEPQSALLQLHALLSLQQADGSFATIPEDCCKSKDSQEVQGWVDALLAKLSGQAAMAGSTDPKVRQTLAALYLLHANFEALADHWALPQSRALAFLALAFGIPAIELETHLKWESITI